MNRRTGRVPQRFDPDRETRRRSRWRFAVLPLALVVVVVFLRGPNGLIQLVRRWYRVRAGDAELVAARRRIDSLEVLRARFNDTVFVRRYAADLLGAEPGSTVERQGAGKTPAVVPGPEPDEEEPPAGLIGTGPDEPAPAEPGPVPGH